jgi:hypothetical protein
MAKRRKKAKPTKRRQPRRVSRALRALKKAAKEAAIRQAMAPQPIRYSQDEVDWKVKHAVAESNHLLMVKGFISTIESAAVPPPGVRSVLSVGLDCARALVKELKKRGFS